MTTEEIKSKILAIIKDKYDEEMSDNQTLDDIDIDSLDAVELVMEIEKEFKISIPDAEMDAWREMKIDSMINLVTKYS